MSRSTLTAQGRQHTAQSSTSTPVVSGSTYRSTHSRQYGQRTRTESSTPPAWPGPGETSRRGGSSIPRERGLEPDECYKLGKLDDDDVPDIAIEVVVSSGLVDKMAVYAGLGVPEVWEWRPGSRAIVVHRLVGDGYQRSDGSEILPGLDLALLSSFVSPGDSQTRLAKAYQAALRAG
jgi:hypothetical protein